LSPRIKLSAAALVLIGLLATSACIVAPPPGAARSEPAIRGQITRLMDREILVEENPDESAGSAKASLRVTNETQILDADGRPTGKALRVGQEVSVWFTGPVMESYPVRGTASKIVIHAQPSKR
jgi:hypothetical protein